MAGKNGSLKFESLESRQLLSVSLSSVAGSDVAYDKQGNLNIAYYDSAAHALKFATQAAAASTLGTSATIDTFTTADLTGQIATAVDPEGNAGIAYYQPVTHALKYAHFDGHVWDVTTVDAKNNSGMKPSLAYDSKGRALITYYQQDTGNLKYAGQAGSKWTKLTVVHHSGGVIAAAVGVNPITGKKVIVYQDKNGQIRYTSPSAIAAASAVNTNPAPASVNYMFLPMYSFPNTSQVNRPSQTTQSVAASRLVDKISQLGTGISLTFDAAGHPVFSYYDPHSGAIKVATKTGGKFSLQSVATVAPSVDPQATVLISSGKTTVVYYNSTLNGLFAASSTTGAFTSTQLSIGGRNSTATLNASGNIAYTVSDATLGTVTVEKTATTPSAPSNLAAVATSTTQINLSWLDNSSNESSFRIDRSTDGTTFTTLGTAVAGALTYSDTTVTEGKTYYYRLFAIGSDSSVTQATVKTGSGTNNAATATTLPAGATTLTASPTTTTTITLHWTDNSSGETGYRVERSTDGGTTYTLLTTTAANVTQYVDSNLTESTTYLYRVTSANATGNGAALTGSFTTMPLAPTALTATVTSPTHVDLAWTDHSAHETAYLVERSVDGGSTFVQIASLAAGTTSYSDTAAPDNTALIYRVRSAINSIHSDYATSAQVTTPVSAPAGATGLSATVISPTRVDLGWTDNSSTETGFLIERSTDGVNYTTLTTTAANAVTFSDTTVTEGVSYHYRVRAVGQFNNSIASNTADAVTALVAPTTLTATTASTTQVDLAWGDNSSVETGYEINRAVDGGGFTLLTTLAANSTSFSDLAAFDGHTYQYQVRAIKTLSNSAFSNTASASSHAAAPTTLTASATSATQVSLTWADNSHGETGYIIERSDDAGNTWNAIATLGANITSYTDATASEISSYSYRVHATAVAGDSDPSTVATVTTPLGAASNLQATAASTSQIDLTWTDNSANEDGFTIQRSDDAGTTWTDIHQSAANDTSYSDTTVSEGASYRYRIVAFKAASAASPSNAVTVIADPAAPSNLAVSTFSDSQVSFSWDDNSAHELNYIVQRSDDAGATFTNIATLSANSTTYVDSSVQEGHDYIYQVIAQIGSINSQPSGTLAVTTAPAAPTLLDAAVISGTQIDLTWTDNSNVEADFRIERSDDGGTTWNTVGLTVANNSAFSDTTLNAPGSYQYRVFAVDANHVDSLASNVAVAEIVV